MNHLEEVLNRSLTETGETHFPLVMMFFSLVITLRPKKILELGVRSGGSTYPLLCGAKTVNSHLTSIDLRPVEFDCPKDLVPYWTFIQSDSIKFLEQNTDNYDLIYIDDWHAYPHVKRELELVEKICNQNTLILMHDLMAMNAPNYFLPDSPAWDNGEFAKGGPFQAVNELNRKEWEWMTLPVSHGLTLLKKIPQIIKA